ncbi:alpha/beta hydrolase [Caldalkalibacillus salinus]|uniref:alpha/beta hydrolase n=1 Tax=Caldalkalibacillus salinus TaxID=2803787 RepID=UPI001922C4C4|nr:alpha/beta hydrolase-fold protein [Caldalkalibacillus salinus]
METLNTRKGTIQDDEVYSRFLDQTVPLMVYLPEHYSPLYSYSTLYLQDGDDYFKLGKLAATLDQLIAANKIDKCMAVAVPVDKEVRTARYRADGEQYAAYKRFFAEELVSYIDRTYATHPMSGARVIGGESLGGSVSLDIALAYPHTFHHVISQSGAFYTGTIERINQFDSHQKLSIYQSVGREETAVETSNGTLDLYALNQDVYQVLQRQHIPVTYHEFDGDHTWGHWQKDLAQALTFTLKKEE